MFRTLFAAIAWLVASSSLHLRAAASDYLTAADRALLLRSCSQCHAIASYTPSDRSAKDWELTLERMRGYAQNSESEFSEEQAARMVQVLAHYPEGRPLSDWLDRQEPEPVAAETARPVPASLPRLIHPQIPISKPHWIFPLARVFGDVALVLLAVMVFSGLLRKPLGARFRPIHMWTAMLLAVLALLHSAVFVVKHGLPNILWFWFGLMAMLVILGAIAGGYLRRQWQGRWFRFHQVAAIIGLLLVLLHWVWFYVR